MGPSVSVHPFIMELLHHLNIAFGQLMPNSWRISISCMEIWMIFNERDMIKLDEFVHLYWLKDSKEFGSMSLYLGIEKLGLSSIFLCHFNTGSLGTSSCLVTIRRLPLMTFGVRFLGCCIDGGCKNSVRHLLQVSFFTIFAFVLTLIYISFFFFN